MAIWLGLQCNLRDEQSAEGGGPACHTHRTDNPGILVAQTTAEQLEGLAYLRRRAREQGWRNKAGRWVGVAIAPRRALPKRGEDAT